MRLVLAFPIMLVVAGAVLVTLGLNGSSSGAFFDDIDAGHDPALISGEPRAIRSDEWNVGTVQTIAQVEQGLPSRSATFPGGMDAAVPYDLPSTDWSMVFRPHLVGYLLLDVDHATAWRWWSMGLSLAAAAYVFALVAMPRRPVAAVGLATAFFFSPFFQWWYQPITLWPVVWALVVMSALLWATRSRSKRSRWVWAAAAAYFTAVMAMGIFVPFIIPVVIVVLFFGIGIVGAQLAAGRSVRDILTRYGGILAAGAAGAVITLIWIVPRKGTVDALLSTVYPGERSTPTGAGGPLSAARAIASSFTESLDRADGFLGLNSSEASTFQLAGLFLIPIAAWLVFRAIRARAVVPWHLASVSAALGLFAANSLIPGWDGAARLLLLDRSTPERTLIGVGLAAFVLLVLVVRELDNIKGPAPQATAIASAAVFVVSQVAIAVAVYVVLGGSRLWGASPLWWLLALLSATVVFAFARRHVAYAVTATLIVSLVGGAAVNPLYVGVFDLRKTPTGRAVMSTDGNDRGTWVAVGSQLAAATLIESGVRAYNGTQGAPPRQMWHDIDPEGTFSDQWNRLGGVRWVAAPGEPVVTNPALDQIAVTFDACSTFAQTHIEYVLADTALPHRCLIPLSSHPTTHSPLTLYRVAQQ